jgi:hypothetical protein
VPAEFSFSQSVALSFSLASGASVPPWAITASFSSTPKAGVAMMVINGSDGSFSTMSTVWGSTTFTSSMCEMYCQGWSLMLSCRVKEKRTSSAVIGLPEANFTSVRSFSRTVFPSGW